jgi:hypothetical protein
MSGAGGPSYVDFKRLAIESRRLSSRHFAIPTFALLINECLLVPDVQPDVFLESADAKHLADFSRIILRRFCDNPSLAVCQMMAEALFSDPPYLGQLFLLELIFQSHFNVLDECALVSIYHCFPDFLQLLLLSRLSANPLSLCPSHRTSLLPLGPPTLSLFKSAGLRDSVLRFLLQLSLEATISLITQALVSEQLGKVFADFVFMTPSFFALAEQILVQDGAIAHTFQCLAQLDSDAFVKSFLLGVRNVSPTVLAVFSEIVDIEHVAAVGRSDPDIFSSFVYYLVLRGRFDIIGTLRAEKEAIICDVLRDIFQNRSQLYSTLLAETDSDIVVLAIAPLFLADADDSPDAIRGSLLGALMRHESFIGLLLERAPAFICRLLSKKKSSFFDPFCDFLRRHTELLDPQTALMPESIPMAIYSVDQAKFLSRFHHDKLGIIVREIIDATFGENQLSFPEHAFFEFLANHERFAEIFKAILIDHQRLIVESPSWLEIFCTLPAFFRLAVEVYISDWHFVARIVNEFSYQTLSAPDLQTVLQAISGQEKRLSGLHLMVQLRFFEAIMNALTVDNLCNSRGSVWASSRD